MDVFVEQVTDQCTWMALHTEEAQAWVAAHVEKPGFWGGRLLVWNHEVNSLITGMERSGLRVVVKH
jgi:hypothetical protein